MKPTMAMLIYFLLGYTRFIMGEAVIGVAIFAALGMTTHDFSNGSFKSAVCGLWAGPTRCIANFRRCSVAA